MIFLDASVLLAAEDADDREHQAALVLLRSGDLATLELALYETTNVAIVLWQDLDAADRLAKRLWAIAEFGTLVGVDRQLGTGVAQLATEHGLSAYDAGYVAAAREARSDARQLQRAGSRPPRPGRAAFRTHSWVTQKRAWSPMRSRGYGRRAKQKQ